MRQRARVPGSHRAAGGRLLLLGGALLAALWLAGCKGEEIMGLGMTDQIKLGQEAGDQFEQKYGLSTDAALRRLVSGIGQRVAAVAKPPDYPYDYRVLLNDQVNANAFPGGRIYVWTGLTKAVQRNPDQLAFVIGHETAHVARGHTAQAIERQMGTDLIVQALLGGKDAAKYVGLVGDLVLQGYGRTAEYEADRIGLGYAQAAGYDPTAAYAVIREFQKLSGNKDPSQVELVFDSHPGNNARLNALQAEIKRNGWHGRYTP
jgi:beta-barrel assembly-enhancing protease